jgi:hypothetical protein
MKKFRVNIARDIIIEQKKWYFKKVIGFKAVFFDK